jgi:hypothetical protein
LQSLEGSDLKLIRLARLQTPKGNRDKAITDGYLRWIVSKRRWRDPGLTVAETDEAAIEIGCHGDMALRSDDEIVRWDLEVFESARFMPSAA